MLKSVAQLELFLAKQNLTLKECGLLYLKQLAQPFPLRIPEHYARLIDWQNPADPLRKMVVPDIQEADVKEYELADPIGDASCEVVPGLIHRYPDRCLLLLTTHCLVHCRYCFRREVVGGVRPIDFKRIVTYLQEHTEIKEIIFSGGDPMTFPTGFLQSLFTYFEPVPHLTTFRFHSRVPVADPNAVTQEWLTVLSRSSKKIILAIHVNHLQEISPETIELCRQLLDQRVLLLSQTVLLKGVNDNFETLSQLWRKLVEIGVKPYYLHHPDQVKGTHHFRVSIEAGKQLFSSLRGNLSSVCLPEYVLDLPGGAGKIPVMWLNQITPDRYQARTFTGNVVEYTDYAHDQVNH